MLDSTEVLHVGDHPVEDLKGAQEAGLHAVLIDRSGTDSYDNHTLPNLASLLELPLLQSSIS